MSSSSSSSSSAKKKRKPSRKGAGSRKGGSKRAKLEVRGSSKATSIEDVLLASQTPEREAVAAFTLVELKPILAFMKEYITAGWDAPESARKSDAVDFIMNHLARYRELLAGESSSARGERKEGKGAAPGDEKRGSMGQGSMGQGSMGQESMGQGSMGQESMGQGSTGQESKEAKKVKEASVQEQMEDVAQPQTVDEIWDLHDLLSMPLKNPPLPPANLVPVLMGILGDIDRGKFDRQFRDVVIAWNNLVSNVWTTLSTKQSRPTVGKSRDLRYVHHRDGTYDSVSGVPVYRVPLSREQWAYAENLEKEINKRITDTWYSGRPVSAAIGRPPPTLVTLLNAVGFLPF